MPLSGVADAALEGIVRSMTGGVFPILDRGLAGVTGGVIGGVLPLTHADQF